jgi:ATP-dependent helicase HrpA
LAAAIDPPLAEVAQLRGLPLNVECDPRLPIARHRDEILAALERHPVIVVCGATGSGKTTQLPKMCLAAGRGVRGMIGHTQPRRIAARALAARIAQELGTEVGGAVGYQVRFADRTGPDCRVKLMTDGILLQELERDPELRRYDTLIIDEAHERTLNIDLLLGVTRRLVTRRPELRVIVTSATIDPEKFAHFYHGAPVIEVSGRSYPVEVRYRPLGSAAGERSLTDGIVDAISELGSSGPAGAGDVLVFLPGERHIREAASALERAFGETAKPAGAARHAGPAGSAGPSGPLEILPLYARLSSRDQERVFAPHARRRIVLATNVAETSLTVPGIRAVVDSGLARVGRYNVRGKIHRLPIEDISRASAEQRKGRCGREAPGICIRLYSEEDFARRDLYTAPEILRTSLATVILQMAARGLGDPELFPFVDPPDARSVNDGIRLLQELRAMDGERRITALGRRMAALPIDPRFGRMLFAAADERCLADMLAIVSFLETPDPRERPPATQRLADEAHARFSDSRSDFISALNLWRAWQSERAAQPAARLRRWCRERFLSWVRMREWQALHDQLTFLVRDLGLESGTTKASYAALHRAILTGLLGSIGRLEDKREYAGARSLRFVIAPGTPLATRPPRWVVAASLLETTRLYARMVALVQPPWIETAAAHLVKRTHSEAHWQRSRGYVAVQESVSLYGLTLASGRIVNFAPIAPAAAREIFAREALVEGRGGLTAPFLTVNGALRAEIESLEARIRRRDILVDDQAQVDFYLARLPARVDTLSGFERWRTHIERSAPRHLFMERAHLMRRAAPEAGPAHYPDSLEVDANRLPLCYRFEPGASDDGVTVLVPQALLSMLDGQALAWLVPGMRLEKLTALLRALPKPLRIRCVPIAEHAALALRDAESESAALPPLFDWLARWLTRRLGAPVEAAELAALPLPDHLRMNVRVIDGEGHPITEGRELAVLRARLKVVANRTLAAPPPQSEPSIYRGWDFGELPLSSTLERGLLRLIEYPAIEDRGAGVAIVTVRSAAEAAAISRDGLARLALIAVARQAARLRKHFAEHPELVLLAHGVALARPIADALLERSVREALFPLGAELPRSAAEFARVLETRAPLIEEVASQQLELVLEILRLGRSVRAALERLSAPAFAAARAEMRNQLGALLAPDFLRSTGEEWITRYPRYLQAMLRRLERLPLNVARDSALAARLRPFSDAERSLDEDARGRVARPEGQRLRWMLEEFRLSLHAQELGTVVRVSEQRIAAQLAAARAELRA